MSKTIGLACFFFFVKANIIGSYLLYVRRTRIGRVLCCTVAAAFLGRPAMRTAGGLESAAEKTSARH